MEDNKLLMILEKDPEKGFKILFDSYQKPLYFYVRKIVLKHEDADDILQNIWIKVYKNIFEFRGDSKISTWLYRIATNETYTFLNKQAKRRHMTLEKLSETQAYLLSSDPFFNGDEISLKLYQAVAQLPERQRQVFQLKYFEDKKYQEISEILELSVGAIKASYHHAVQKIKDYVLKETEI